MLRKEESKWPTRCGFNTNRFSRKEEKYNDTITWIYSGTYEWKKTTWKGHGGMETEDDTKTEGGAEMENDTEMKNGTETESGTEMENGTETEKQIVHGHTITQRMSQVGFSYPTIPFCPHCPISFVPLTPLFL